MSQFFETFDEDVSENKHRIRRNETNEPTKKLSKKEKAIMELQSKVYELENDDKKKFEKKIKRFISDLKKYETMLDECPDFLEKFLKSDRVYVKSNIKIVDGFLSVFESKDDKEVDDEETVVDTRNKKADKTFDQEFATILNITDRNEKIRRLEILYSNTSDCERKRDVAVILLSSYNRFGNFISLFKLLKEIEKPVTNEKLLKILTHNISDYLKNIFSIISDVGVDEYYSLLKQFSFLNSPIVERRLLEIDFYFRNNPVLSEYSDFNLSFHVINSNREDINKSFDVIKNELDFENNIYHEKDEFEDIDMILLKNLYIYGSFLFDSKEYLEAYKVFAYVYTRGFVEAETNIFILCIILNHKVEDTVIFKKFLVDFRDIEDNIFALETHDVKKELYRAFYFLNMYDIEKCLEIIRRYHKSFDDQSVLNSFVLADIE